MPRVTSDWEAVVQRTGDPFARRNVLVSNAGLLFSEGMEVTTPEEFANVANQNLLGVFLTMKHAIPLPH